MHLLKSPPNSKRSLRTGFSLNSPDLARENDENAKNLAALREKNQLDVATIRDLSIELQNLKADFKADKENTLQRHAEEIEIMKGDHENVGAQPSKSDAAIVDGHDN